jgi:hypothetical protein
VKALKILILGACFGGVIYLNVWQRVEILKAGYEIARQEKKKEELLKERRLLRLEYSRVSAFDRMSGSARDEFSDSVFESMEIVDVLMPRGVSGGGSRLED